MTIWRRKITFFSPSAQRDSRHRAKGFTLLEVLLALAIAMTFMAALYTSFITMMRVADRNAARLEAQRNLRTAIMTILDELKAISGLSSSFVPTLIGINVSAPNGDGIDNDGDARTDEEIVNGRDDDFDWVGGLDDYHAQIGLVNPLYDRFQYTDKIPFNVRYGTDADDLGDAHVDEDCKFGRDSIVFRIVPTTPIPDILFRTITYTVGTFDGDTHVLIRQARTEFDPASGKTAGITTAPLAFGLLGLDLLYWNPNGNPNPGSTRAERPYWVETWDSNDSANFQPPKLPLPAAIYVRLTSFAEKTNQDSYADGRPVQTLKMDSVVDLEQIIGDIAYPRASI